ncbi:MAG: hypothetical protein LBB38_00765, partial [Puniceicoccales bacterium]|nr:hypothetical protein [Puniceicoccales bacterium]
QAFAATVARALTTGNGTKKLPDSDGNAIAPPIPTKEMAKQPTDRTGSSNPQPSTATSAKSTSVAIAKILSRPSFKGQRRNSYTACGNASRSSAAASITSTTQPPPGDIGRAFPIGRHGPRKRNTAIAPVNKQTAPAQRPTVVTRLQPKPMRAKSPPPPKSWVASPSTSQTDTETSFVEVTFKANPPPELPKHAQGNTARYVCSTRRHNLSFNIFERGGGGDCYPHSLAGQLEIFSCDSNRDDECRKALFNGGLKAFSQRIGRVFKLHYDPLEVACRKIPTARDLLAEEISRLHYGGGGIAQLIDNLQLLSDATNGAWNAYDPRTLCANVLAKLNRQNELVRDAAVVVNELAEKCVGAKTKRSAKLFANAAGESQNATNVAIGYVRKFMLQLGGAHETNEPISKTCSGLAAMYATLLTETDKLICAMTNLCDNADGELAICEEIKSIHKTVNDAISNGVDAKTVYDKVTGTNEKIIQLEKSINVKYKRSFNNLMFLYNGNTPWHSIYGGNKGETGFGHHEHAVDRYMHHMCHYVAVKHQFIGEDNWLTACTFETPSVQISNKNGKVDMYISNGQSDVAMVSFDECLFIKQVAGANDYVPLDFATVNALMALWGAADPKDESGRSIPFPQLHSAYDYADRDMSDASSFKTAETIRSDATIPGKNLDEKLDFLNDELLAVLEFLVAHSIDKLGAPCCYCINLGHWQQAVLDRESIRNVYEKFFRLFPPAAAESQP